WSSDKPAVPAEPVAEVLAGRRQDIVRRLEPGDEVHRVGRSLSEAQEGVHVMNFTPHRLDSPLQLAAVGIAGQYGVAFTFDEAPEHPVEQTPAAFAAIAGGTFQPGQEFRRDAQATAGKCCGIVIL